MFFSAQHASKNPGFVLRPLSPYAIASLGVAYFWSSRARQPHAALTIVLLLLLLLLLIIIIIIIILIIMKTLLLLLIIIITIKVIILMMIVIVLTLIVIMTTIMNPGNRTLHLPRAASCTTRQARQHVCLDYNHIIIIIEITYYILLTLM